jgi:hypothetical protein
VHLSAESASVNSGKHPWEQEQTDGITHITTEAITIDIVTKGITTGITMADTTTGTGVGLSVSMGVQGITAIGKRITVRTALTIL